MNAEFLPDDEEEVECKAEEPNRSCFIPKKQEKPKSAGANSKPTVESLQAELKKQADISKKKVAQAIKNLETKHKEEAKEQSEKLAKMQKRMN